MTVAAHVDPTATVSRFDRVIQQIRSYIEEFAAAYDLAKDVEGSKLLRGGSRDRQREACSRACRGRQQRPWRCGAGAQRAVWGPDADDRGLRADEDFVLRAPKEMRLVPFAEVFSAEGVLTRSMAVGGWVPRARLRASRGWRPTRGTRSATASTRSPTRSAGRTSTSPDRSPGPRATRRERFVVAAIDRRVKAVRSSWSSGSAVGRASSATGVPSACGQFRVTSVPVLGEFDLRH